MRRRKTRTRVSPSLHMLFIHPPKGPLRLLLPPRLNPRLWDSTITTKTTNARSNATKNVFMLRLLRMERMNQEREPRLAFKKEPSTDHITLVLSRNHPYPLSSTKYACTRTLPSTFSTLFTCFRPEGNDFGSRDKKKINLGDFAILSPDNNM